jgi:DNA-binding SARP family transcriptional activator
MRELKVMLLGPFSVRDGTRTVRSHLFRKAQDILTLLLLAPEQRVLRESAAEALWPDASTNTSRKAMRQALWQLHQLADSDEPPARRLVLADGDALLVNPDRSLWVDVPVFTDAARRAEAIPSGGFESADLAGLAQAAALYRGPMHAGCYNEWCLIPRAHLEDRCLSLLDTLSREHERRGEYESAIRWGQRLVEIEPAHERTHRRLMRLYARTGDRTRALRQLEYCRRVLEHEFGMRPEARTDELGMAIRAGRVPHVDPLEPGETAAARSDDQAVVEDLRAEIAALRDSIEAMGDRLPRATA